jgi:predicted kinase
VKEKHIMIVQILRGIPGSGKSTWARSCASSIGATICSADYFHMIDGEYMYNRDNAGAAHTSCVRAYLDCMKAGETSIIVDNTNTLAHEIAPYVALAKVYAYDFEIVEFPVDLVTAYDRQTHDVPYGTVAMMHRNMLMEVLPARWSRTLGVNYSPGAT